MTQTKQVYFLDQSNKNLPVCPRNVILSFCSIKFYSKQRGAARPGLVILLPERKEVTSVFCSHIQRIRMTILLGLAGAKAVQSIHFTLHGLNMQIMIQSGILHLLSFG